jgi:hypothetical protein
VALETSNFAGLSSTTRRLSAVTYSRLQSDSFDDFDAQVAKNQAL